MQVLKGQEDQEMAKEIGLLSNRKVKKVIPEWGMWWRWLMPSLPVWQASLESLKVTTIVPNPLGISPQRHVPCGWRRAHMHKHYNMYMHSYFLCNVTLIVCVLFVIILAWFEIFFVLFVFTLNVFTFCFWSIFTCFCVKNPKTHKK